MDAQAVCHEAGSARACWDPATGSCQESTSPVRNYLTGQEKPPSLAPGALHGEIINTRFLKVWPTSGRWDPSGDTRISRGWQRRGGHHSAAAGAALSKIASWPMLQANEMAASKAPSLAVMDGVTTGSIPGQAGAKGAPVSGPVISWASGSTRWGSQTPVLSHRLSIAHAAGSGSNMAEGKWQYSILVVNEYSTYLSSQSRRALDRLKANQIKNLGGAVCHLSLAVEIVNQLIPDQKTFSCKERFIQSPSGPDPTPTPPPTPAVLTLGRSRAPSTLPPLTVGSMLKPSVLVCLLVVLQKRSCWAAWIVIGLPSDWHAAKENNRSSVEGGEEEESSCRHRWGHASGKTLLADLQWASLGSVVILGMEIPSSTVDHGDKTSRKGQKIHNSAYCRSTQNRRHILSCSMCGRQFDMLQKGVGDKEGMDLAGGIGKVPQLRALGRQGQKERDKRPGRSYIRDHCTCDLRSALVLLLFADAAHCPHAAKTHAAVAVIMLMRSSEAHWGHPMDAWRRVAEPVSTVACPEPPSLAAIIPPWYGVLLAITDNHTPPAKY
ncbi:uncharacterized protein BO96DRAFT_343430 [Aspergillus niger CBS 101883]|uniref:uncharacterized protein n=1 Tax=Aspergillus lacticoffeatus (strain CBS 101883) TaxID=1450533 RepID=UPI000D7F1922|nr:uncharacterized protein BO96DRAFT_343430 [Aspergillus niger CBS 101883]PYH54143.1 hypothetical protein BO96DRAFT_343430 [Aspergillus niger CBS 101883]